MKVKTTTEVRAQFQEMVDRVHYTKAPLIVTKNNKPWVMVQPLPEGDKELMELIKKSKK